MITKDQLVKWKEEIIDLLNTKNVFVFENYGVLVQSNEEEFSVITKDLVLNYNKDQEGYFTLDCDIKIEQWIKGTDAGDLVVFVLKQFKEQFIKNNYKDIKPKNVFSHTTVEKTVEVEKFNDEDFIEY